MTTAGIAAGDITATTTDRRLAAISAASRPGKFRAPAFEPACALHVAYHGSEYVFVFVKLFIASCTPSLYPSPESFTPPNGVSSSR